MRSRQGRQAFTLIELLVVMVIIAMLASLLLTGVQAARESARKTLCVGNLKQIGLAIHNYEAARGVYPPSWLPTAPNGSGDVNGWSVHAQLLPYLEQKIVRSKIDFTEDYNANPTVTTADGTSRRLSAMRIPTYVCPSEIRDEVRFSGGEPMHYPLNYGVNSGIWFVWDPDTGQGGAGAFFPNSRLTAGDFRDGLSFTTAAAEVKGWNPYYRNAGADDPALGSPCSMGGDFKSNSGHTEWVDGRVHQIGYTSAFGPNTKVLCTVSGTVYDVDWTNQQEGKSASVKTYAAVTARSYHEGIVNVLMMDGSTKSVDDRIHLGVWRAVSTRAGGELLPDSFNK